MERKPAEERRSESPQRPDAERRIEELHAEIDERDEIIRQLNAALSLALDELTLPKRAA